MTGCYDTNESLNTSSWTRFSPQREVENRPEDIPAASFFVTDKGFVYVVPMRTKSEVLQAVKQFAKEVGAPDAIISDMSHEQTSRSLRKF